MESSRIMITLFSLVTLALILPSYGQTPQEYVDAHNAARAVISCSPLLNNVVWNTTLEAYALTYANAMKSTCSLTHSAGPYGENLAKGSSSTFTGISAINLWVAEKPNYTYSTNSCAPTKVCGHYTQVVWRSSTQIGCARVQCTNTWYYVICSYYGPGNYVGQSPY